MAPNLTLVSMLQTDDIVEISEWSVSLLTLKDDSKEQKAHCSILVV